MVVYPPRMAPFGPVRLQTLWKRVSDDPRHFIFRHRNIFFGNIFCRKNVQRQKIKNSKSSQTLFAKVSRQLEPSLKDKRLFKVSHFSKKRLWTDVYPPKLSRTAMKLGGNAFRTVCTFRFLTSKIVGGIFRDGLLDDQRFDGLDRLYFHSAHGLRFEPAVCGLKAF